MARDESCIYRRYWMGWTLVYLISFFINHATFVYVPLHWKNQGGRGIERNLARKKGGRKDR